MHIKYTRLLISLIVVTLVAYGAYSLSTTFSQPNLRIDLSQSSVVTKMQALNKIETAQFALEKIIDAGYQGNFFQNILYGDRILLIAHADIVAGFDLSKIGESDVKVRTTQLVVKLPAPEILVSRLDNEKTRVYDRRTGFLAASDKDLESQARAQAEAAIKKDACDAGILDIASENAKAQLELLFKAAGFTEVVIIIPAGNCN